MAILGKSSHTLRLNTMCHITPINSLQASVTGEEVFALDPDGGARLHAVSPRPGRSVACDSRCERPQRDPGEGPREGAAGTQVTAARTRDRVSSDRAPRPTPMTPPDAGALPFVPIATPPCPVVAPFALVPQWQQQLHVSGRRAHWVGAAAGTGSRAPQQARRAGSGPASPPRTQDTLPCEGSYPECRRPQTASGVSASVWPLPPGTPYP